MYLPLNSQVLSIASRVHFRLASRCKSSGVTPSGFGVSSALGAGQNVVVASSKISSSGRNFKAALASYADSKSAPHPVKPESRRRHTADVAACKTVKTRNTGSMGVSMSSLPSKGGHFKFGVRLTCRRMRASPPIMVSSSVNHDRLASGATAWTSRMVLDASSAR